VIVTSDVLAACKPEKLQGGCSITGNDIPSTCPTCNLVQKLYEGQYLRTYGVKYLIESRRRGPNIRKVYCIDDKRRDDVLSRSECLVKSASCLVDPISSDDVIVDPARFDSGPDV
jgi:hypothetical protein